MAIHNNKYTNIIIFALLVLCSLLGFRIFTKEQIEVIPSPNPNEHINQLPRNPKAQQKITTIRIQPSTPEVNDKRNHQPPSSSKTREYQNDQPPSSNKTREYQNDQPPSSNITMEYQKDYAISTFKNYSMWRSLGGHNDKNELLNYFLEFLEYTHTYCPDRVRAGRAGDGGWWVCTAPPFAIHKQDCLVYSFGIDYDFSFDDDMANIYKCTVRSYDPSMNKGSWKYMKHGEVTKRGDNIWFYKIGIGGKNKKSNGKTWKVQTFAAILADNLEQHKTIDMLKIDIEGNELASFLTMIKENSLQNVKQLAFEIHVSKLYKEFFNILKQIEEIGFRKYLYKPNDYYPEACMEIFYLNSKYFKI